MDEFAYLEIAELQPHPSNPRLDYRRDVFKTLVVQMRERGFDDACPVIVRELDEGYQILSGHNRVEAAREGGLREVPCVIRSVDDRDAMMLLATANVQRPLSNLEHGQHSIAAEAVGVSVKDYAAQCGIRPENLSRYRGAAKLYLELRDRLAQHQVAGLRDKAEQLWEISGAPKDRQLELVLECCEKDWSVKRTREIVKATVASILPSERQTAAPAEPSIMTDDVATPAAVPARGTTAVVADATQIAETLAPLGASPRGQLDTSHEAVLTELAEPVSKNATIERLSENIFNALCSARVTLHDLTKRLPAGKLRDALDTHQQVLADYVDNLDRTLIQVETTL